MWGGGWRGTARVLGLGLGLNRARLDSDSVSPNREGPRQGGALARGHGVMGSVTVRVGAF